VSLAAILPDPPHAIGLILRANPAVTYAAVDGNGFIASQRRRANKASLGALETALGTVASARTNAPEVVRVAEDELERHVRVAVGLRSRASRAVTIKGHPPGAARGGRIGGPRAVS
jgi:hypothetical protein